MGLREKLLVFLIFFLIFSFFSSFKTAVQIPDEEYVIKIAQNLVELKPLTLPDVYPYKHPGVTETGRDGKRFSSYPIGQSLVVAPFYFISKKLNVLFSPKKDSMTFDEIRKWSNDIETETTRYLYVIPALFSALTCLLFYLFCFSMGFKRITCLISASIFAFCTMTWPYSKFLLSESTQTFFLLLTVYLLFLQRQNGFSIVLMIFAGLSFGMLNIIKPTFLILFPAIVVYWYYKNYENKRQALISGLLFFGLFMLIFSIQIWYNSYRFSQASNFGYSRGGFSSPFYTGLWGLLLSSGKSFFLYSPVTLLFFFSVKRFFKKFGLEAYLFCAIIILIIGTYANWNVWSGDMSWGPRFLLVLIPFFMIPSALIIEDLIDRKNRIKLSLVSLLVLASLLVQIPIIAVHYLHYLNYFKNNVSFVPGQWEKVEDLKGYSGTVSLRDHYFDYQFVPEFSPILGQWWVFKNIIFKSKSSFENTPWKGLGLNKFHRNKPLKTRWDLWIVEIINSSFERGNFGNLFYVFTMIFLIPLVIMVYLIDIKFKKGFNTTVKDSSNLLKINDK